MQCHWNTKRGQKREETRSTIWWRIFQNQMKDIKPRIREAQASLVAQTVKESACKIGDPGLIPRWRRFPWRREWQPTPVFLPGEFHGQKNLEGYSPSDHKESHITEWLTHTRILSRLNQRKSTVRSIPAKTYYKPKTEEIF